MPKLKVRMVVCSTLIGIAAATVFSQSLQYPAARKVDQVDSYHGVKVADPYRWLEDDNSPETAAWIEAENKITFPYLERIPYRQQFQERVKRLNDYVKYSAPSHKGPYVFFFRNDGLQNQSVIYVQQGFDGTPEVLIDPNAWSAMGPSVWLRFHPRAMRSTPPTVSPAVDPTGRSSTSWIWRRKRSSTTSWSG